MSAPNESGEHALTIVIAVVSGQASLRPCLAALIPQADPAEIEIIVPYDHWSSDVGDLAREFPQVRFHFCEDVSGASVSSGNSISGRAHGLYDRRRAVGLSLARGGLIAMTEDHAVPAADWVRQIRSAHTQPHAVIGGVIDNAIDRPLNWAVYYCDFGRYGSPLKAAGADYVSDVNVSYKRAALEAIRDLWREAYHETTVHWALQSRGETLWLDPRLVVFEHRPAITLRQAYRERIEWGRVFAETRVAVVSGWRRLLYGISAPVLPVLLFFRALRQMRRQRRTLRQMIETVPLLFVLLTGWAIGELIGYVAGVPIPVADPDLRELARRT